MALPDRNSQKDNKRNGDPNFNWRGVILFAIAFALIGLAVLFRGGTGYGTEEDVPLPHVQPGDTRRVGPGEKVRVGKAKPPRRKASTSALSSRTLP